jgi:hypothetical protein
MTDMDLSMLPSVRPLNKSSGVVIVSGNETSEITRKEVLHLGYIYEEIKNYSTVLSATIEELAGSVDSFSNVLGAWDVEDENDDIDYENNE